MTLDQIVDEVRRKAGDWDSAGYRYTTNQIAKAVGSVRRTLAVRKLQGMQDLVVTTTDGAETIAPEPTDEQGVILVTGATLLLLRGTYAGRLDRGEIGIAWQSGLEQESTIQADKAYSAHLTKLEHELEELLLIVRAPTSATRPQ